MSRFENMTIKDGCGTDQLACVEPNGGLAVNVQDQHTRVLDLKFIRALAAPTTLTVEAAVGDTSITVNNTAGFADDVTVGLFTPAGAFYFAEQIGAVAGSVITLDTPIDTVFPIGSNVLAAEHHINSLAGTLASPQIYQIGPVGGSTGVEVDITRILGVITGTGAMNASTFGDIGILTNGCVLRQVNGSTTNIWNVQSNGDLSLICFDGSYRSTSQPSVNSSYSFRNTYAGQSKHGVTIRLEVGDSLQLLIQDDLTGLDDFQMMAQGHLVID